MNRHSHSAGRPRRSVLGWIDAHSDLLQVISRASGFMFVPCLLLFLFADWEPFWKNVLLVAAILLFGIGSCAKMVLYLSGHNARGNFDLDS